MPFPARKDGSVGNQRGIGREVEPCKKMPRHRARRTLLLITALCNLLTRRRGFGAGDEFRPVRVQAKSPGIEHQGVGATGRIIRQTMDDLTIAKPPGAAFGKNWQWPCPLGPDAAATWIERAGRQLRSSLR